MGKLLILCLVLVFMGAIWSLPLYIGVNLVLWLFHISFHLTWFQAFSICFLASIIKNLLFSKGDT